MLFAVFVGSWICFLKTQNLYTEAVSKNKDFLQNRISVCFLCMFGFLAMFNLYKRIRVPNAD